MYSVCVSIICKKYSKLNSVTSTVFPHYYLLATLNNKGSYSLSTPNAI